MNKELIDEKRENTKSFTKTKDKRSSSKKLINTRKKKLKIPTQQNPLVQSPKDYSHEETIRRNLQRRHKNNPLPHNTKKEKFIINNSSVSLHTRNMQRPQIAKKLYTVLTVQVYTILCTRQMTNKHILYYLKLSHPNSYGTPKHAFSHISFSCRKRVK